MRALTGAGFGKRGNRTEDRMGKKERIEKEAEEAADRAERERDDLRQRVKELEEERELLRDEITRFRDDFISPRSWASYKLDRILAGKEGK